MNKLEIIENELVPVYETSTGEKVVYGSELHEVLGAPSVYREWVKRRLSDIDAVENEEFQGVEISTPSGQTISSNLTLPKKWQCLRETKRGNKFVDISSK